MQKQRKSDDIGNDLSEWLKWLTRRKNAWRRMKKWSLRRTRWVEHQTKVCFFFCQPMKYESLSPELENVDLLLQLLLESQGLFNSRYWSGIKVCRLNWIGKLEFAGFFEIFFFNAMRRRLESSWCPSGGSTVDLSEIAVRDCFVSLPEL